MTARPRYNKRPAPARYDAGFWNVELANIQRGIPAQTETVDLRDFGIPTASTPRDYATELQQAFNQMPAGGTLLFPAGTTVWLGSAVAIRGAVTIEAAGATLRPVPGTALTQLLGGTDVSNVTILGLAFDGQGTVSNCLAFYSTAASPSNLRIDRCAFTGTATDDALNFAGVRVFATAGFGSAFQYQDVTIQRSRFTNLGTHGAVIQYASDIRFVGNEIDTIHNHGFEAVSCTSVALLDNDVRHTRFDGLAIGAQSSYFLIANNRVKDCAQVTDAAISVENTCTYGSVAANVVWDCQTTGIVVGYSGSVSPDNLRVQNVSVLGNTVKCRAGVTDKTGIIMYSTTGAGFGTGNEIADNSIDGFNLGIAAYYMGHGAIRDNQITNLVGTGAHMIDCTFVTDYEIAGNQCDTATADHAIQFHSQPGVPANQCDSVAVSDNHLAGTAAGKAAVSWEGTGLVSVHDNQSPTVAVDAWLTVSDNAVVGVNENVGTVTTANITGAGTPTIRLNTNNWAR